MSGVTALVMAALQAPFVSPRLVGQVILPSIAKVGKGKDAIYGIFESIHRKVPAEWATDGLTYYQAAQRLDEMYRREAGHVELVEKVNETDQVSNLSAGIPTPVFSE